MKIFRKNTKKSNYLVFKKYIFWDISVFFSQNYINLYMVFRDNSIEFNKKDQTLRIRWADGHESDFTTAQILRWSLSVFGFVSF